MAARAIFVTGASSGIGLASTRRLHAAGFHVFAGVYPGEDASVLDALDVARLTVIPIDITDAAMIAAAEATIRAQVGADGLYGLFNNAAIGASSPLEFTPLALLREVLEVNVVGHVAVTQALLPMLRQARGRVLNTASFLGRVAAPYAGIYSMSKFALEAYSDALRMELAPQGVRVSILEPGVVITRIWANSRITGDDLLDDLPDSARALYGKDFARIMDYSQREAASGIPPEQVAEAVFHAFSVRRPRTRYRVGIHAHLAEIMRRFFPAALIDLSFRLR